MVEIPGLEAAPPWWRPGEAAQRDLTDMIHEWRQARNSLIAAEERLSIALDWNMVADLAVRDESAHALDKPPTPRPTLQSRRRYAQSKRVAHDIAEAG